MIHLSRYHRWRLGQLGFKPHIDSMMNFGVDLDRALPRHFPLDLDGDPAPIIEDRPDTGTELDVVVTGSARGILPDQRDW